MGFPAVPEGKIVVSESGIRDVGKSCNQLWGVRCRHIDGTPDVVGMLSGLFDESTLGLETFEWASNAKVRDVLGASELWNSA